MKIKLDPTRIQSSEVPEGDYECVPLKMFKNTSNAGNRGAGIQLEVKEGEFAGRKLMGNITVTEAALWKVNQLYKAVTGSDLPEMEFDSEDELLDWLWQEISGQMVKVRAKSSINPNTGDVRLDLSYLSS